MRVDTTYAKEVIQKAHKDVLEKYQHFKGRVAIVPRGRYKGYRACIDAIIVDTDCGVMFLLMVINKKDGTFLNNSYSESRMFWDPTKLELTEEFYKKGNKE